MSESTAMAGESRSGTMIRRGIDHAVPVAVIFVVVMILWYCFVAYFNYKTLEVVLREGFGLHP
jgi:hypothetical protein